MNKCCEKWKGVTRGSTGFTITSDKKLVGVSAIEINFCPQCGSRIEGEYCTEKDCGSLVYTDKDCRVICWKCNKPRNFIAPKPKRELPEKITDIKYCNYSKETWQGRVQIIQDKINELIDHINPKP